MTLRDLEIGQSAVIKTVGGRGALRQHFLDMGVIPGAEITLVKYAPMGDPIELRIHGYELTLRLDDAAQIEIGDPYRSEESEEPKKVLKQLAHPGLGEEGRYHVKTDADPLPKDELLTFALAGNQNCGKTTLFNALTGANQHVGNFPGVTVDSKSGPILRHPNTLVTDLPGIYSLSPYTAEEIVSRNFIIDEKPRGIINIVDATNIKRSLYLTLQLMELGVPMVLALNFFEEVENNGGAIDVNIMEELLGVPVVPVSAVKGDGVEELVSHAIHVARNQERPGRRDFCDAQFRNGAVHRAIHGITHLIEDHATNSGIPARFAATKLIEGDPLIAERLQLSENEIETIEHMVITMEEEGGLDRSAAIADMRYSFIGELCDKAVVKVNESKEHRISTQIDKILTGKYTAIPAFIIIMGLIFVLTFNVIGAGLQNLLASGIERLTEITDAALTAADVNEGIHSLVIDGIFTGVGGVLSFIPVILVLFLFLSLLEDSGYMARVAFVMDKLLRKLGLSGRSIVPMLIGFGCTVPGVMATRTLPSARDRKMTIILTPFMSCSAKLPIYGFISYMFFPNAAGLVMIGLYLLGILMAIVVALISKNTMFKGEAVPFVMELPNYRLPGIKNTLMLLWEKGKDFLERAFSVLLIATVIIWFLSTFGPNLQMVDDAQNSILAMISGKIAPVFTLQGFSDWRFVTALLSGFLAKESVVSTLIVLFGSENAVMGMLTTASALAFLAFCLLYTPCVAAIASIKRELGWKWAIGLIIFQCLVAWVISLLVFVIAGGLIL
ncbi:MAG: ferrous iron transport protein B [Lachnospiraceae bacterium]|nr:ferrous iron transport protein B [Lachnospiraceae bacterium]